MSNPIKICPQCRMSKITNTKFNTCYECHKFNQSETEEDTDQPILKREQKNTIIGKTKEVVGVFLVEILK